MKIYLAGHVPKGDKEAQNFNEWRDRFKKVLKSNFKAEFINPYNRKVDEEDSLFVFGFDCAHIKESDLIIINAEDRLGVGTSQEMVIAKYFKKPVITVLPKQTHHRRKDVVFNGKNIDDWIHPFVFAFSDFIIEDINKIADIKDKIFNSKIKDISVIEQAIKYSKSKSI